MLPVFFGVAYGRVVIEAGMLCLSDQQSGSVLPLITPERSVAERLLAAEGEAVKLTFELCDLTHLGYVIPRQLERCPEEYNPPQMEALIFTDQAEAGLREGTHNELPCIIGCLMGTHKEGRLMDPHSFELTPLDFAVLMGRLRDPQDSPWMGDMVVRARLEVARGGGFNSFRLLELLSVQPISEWEAEQFNPPKPLALPSTEAPAANDEKPKRRAIPTRLRYEVLRRDGHRCVDCGASPQDDPFVRLEIDHRLPVSKGGTNDLENLQTLCWACNNGKSDRIDHKLPDHSSAPDPWVIAC